MLKELTPEMKSQLVPYRNAQIEMSKSTREADWLSAKEAALKMFELSNVTLDDSHSVVYAENPVKAAILGNSLSGERNSLFQCPSYRGTSARNNFFVEVCKVKIDDDSNNKRIVLDQFINSCGGAYFSAKVTVIYDRPSVLKISTTNDIGVLHCEDGPAIAWGRDSSGNYSHDAHGALALYYWEGVAVPAHWIENKPKTDEDMAKLAAEVLSSTNQEQLRAGCEILGWVPVLKSLGMKVLDEDPNPQFGQLVSVDLPNAPNSKFILATCGTGRQIAVPADPESSTAIEAGARSYGLPVEIYRRLKVRT
jgi:hypothetical protein